MITLRHTALGKAPGQVISLTQRSLKLNKDLYLTIHNAHKRQISMPRRDSVLQSQLARGHTDPSRRLCIHWNWLCNIEI